MYAYDRVLEPLVELGTNMFTRKFDIVVVEHSIK